jgi:cation:H+ antiporter
MTLWIIVFIVSLLALVKSADWFTRGAEEVGLFFGLSQFVLGVTLVAIGTSLPELISSVFAVAQGSPEIVIGNVVGANISNLFLVLGLAAVVAGRLTVNYAIVKVDLPIFVSAAALLGLSALDGTISRFEGAVLLAGAFIYGVYGARAARRNSTPRSDEGPRPARLRLRALVQIVGGAAVLYFAAEYTIRSVVELSTIFGVGADLIAITVLSLGTTLPEMVVSVVVTRRGKPEIAVGNVLGSCVFNAFAVAGLPALISPLPITDTVLKVGLPFVAVATALYFFFVAHDREVTRWEGMLLALFYVLFIGKLFAAF